MASFRNLIVRIGAVNLASRGFDAAAASATTFQQRMQRMDAVGQRMMATGRRWTTAVTLPLVGIGVAAVKTSTEFETSMTKITSLVGVPRAQVNAWKTDVRDLAVQFGKSGTEAADALFFITSAGLKGDTAMKALEASLKASAVGLGDTKTIADLATSAMNAYKNSGLTAAQATDTLAAAVREGKLEAPELAGAMGQVLPVASAMGVRFDEAGAALAAMSRTGTNAAEASTQLRAILSGLLKPSDGAQKAMAAMGLSAEGLRTQLREQGLLSVLQTLNERFDGNKAAAAKVFPNVRALAGFLDLMGGNAGDTAKIFQSLENSTGSLDKAFNETKNTAGFQMNQAMAAFKDALISIGDVIAPFVISLAGGLRNVAGALAGLTPGQQKWIVGLAAAAAAIGPLLIGIGALISAFAKIGMAFKVLSALLSANPWGLLIAGIVLLVVLVVTNWDKIKNAIGAAWAWIQNATAAAWAAIKNAVKAAVDFVVNLFLNFTLPGLLIKHWDKIKATARAAWQAFVALIGRAIGWVLGHVAKLAALPGKVRAWFASLAKGAITKAVQLVAWIRGLPGRIRRGLGNLGRLLWNAGRQVLIGLWNGLRSLGGWLRSQIIALISNILPGPVKRVLGIASASKLFASIGHDVGRGLVAGMDASRALVTSAAVRLAHAAVVEPTIAPGPNLDPGILGLSAPAADRRNATHQTEGSGVTVNVVNNYPQAEPTSATVNRALQYAGALGIT